MKAKTMTTTRCAVGFLLLVLLTPTVRGWADPIDGAGAEQLRQWLKEYPQADANHDGVLSVEEARAYYQKLQSERLQGPSSPQGTFRHEFTLATMSDGVKIALAVGYPRDLDPADASRKWSAIFVTCGYTSVTMPANPADYGHRYVTVQASIRGSGASGGALSPWNPRTWQDGYEIIENWIVKQPWSNGRVGIEGYSWPGLMGFLTATTNPPSLKAVCVGGLIDDFYRGICYVGGVRNSGFPVDWLNNYYRADGPFGSGAAALQARGLDDAAYRSIVEGRPVRDLTRDILWDLLHEPLDGPKWQVQNLATYASQIRAPIMIGHAWQDEQTGPGGWQLWQRVPEDVPKRLFLTNGNHGVGPTPGADRDAWFAHWLLDRPDAEAVDPARRVECYFETRCEVRGGPGIRGEPLFAADFPLPGTRFTRYYLCTGSALSTNPPQANETADRYAVTHAPPSGAESRVIFRLQFEEPTAICGPAVLTLWATLTTIDTDFYVLLADEAPDGTFYGLQRGLLRASHRAIDPQRSDYIECDGARLLIRPHHPHTTLQPVTPHEPTEYQIEIPAFGHVLRPGHKLALVLTQPMEGDWIGVTKSGAPSYRYDSHPPPGIVTVLHDAAHPSSLLLPVLLELPPLPDPPVPIDQQAGLQPAGDRDAVR
jgi:predicted acyl esterase